MVGIQKENKFRMKAERMFLQGASMNEIIEKFKLSYATPYLWRRKYAWDEKLKRLNDQLSDVIFNDVLEQKKKALKAIGLALDKFIYDIEEGKINVNASSLAQLINAQQKILTPQSVNRGWLDKDDRIVSEEDKVRQRINQILKIARDETDK
jgi:hypothetical protein